jgi:ferricrocin synthase
MELTQFPHLFADDCDPENAETVETTFDILPSSREGICKAWASLLMAYTGHEDVLYLMDDLHIKVSSQSLNTEELSSPGLRIPSLQGCTAIFFDRPKLLPELALSLRCDLLSGSCVFRSSGYVPAEFLKNIQVQLRQTVAWFKDNVSTRTPPSLLSSLPRSIANGSPRQLSGPNLLHELVKQEGEQVALEFREVSGSRVRLSFTELNERSLQVSRAIYAVLGNRMTDRQPIVAIMLSQSAELYIAQLGALKSGCGFCCISVDTPEDRLKFILEDIGAEVIITKSALVKTTSAMKTQHLLVDNLQEDDETMISNRLVFKAKAKDIVYVMYTSGSTGLPKGVPVSHRAVTQSLLAHNEHIPSFSRFLQFAAPTFDVSIFEIYFPLFRGKTVVSCDRMSMLNDLIGIMNELEIDAAELTPTVASSLLQRREAVPKLKLLLTIGEMLSKRVIREFGGNDQEESILWAMYGPTEAAIHCTLQPAMKSTSKVGNIGKPLSSVSAFVISLQESDDSGQKFDVLPIGSVGELAVGGWQLAEGYLHRPEQTTSVFIDGTPWGRVYRTGDKARMLPDGSIECLGRISSGQIKLRGQRVELGEIEHTALRVTGCKNSVAMVIKASLVLFCNVDRGVVSAHILDECLKWLPSHMVPSEILLSDQFPYLASGKVNKSRLQENYEKSLDLSDVQDADLDDETVRVIHKVLQETLGHQFSAKMNLTSAGVDSLVAIKLASRLRQLDFKITPLDILKSANLSDLRDVIQQNAQTNYYLPFEEHKPTQQHQPAELEILARKHPVIKSRWMNVDGVYKCTSSQVGMLIETAVRPHAYCNWIEIETPSGLVESEIRAWLLELIERYQPLRSSLVQTDLKDHRFIQVIWKRIPENAIETVVEIRKDDFHIDDTSFIAHPVKFQLSINPGKRSKIIIMLHHAVYDGWSIDLLVRDFELLFTGMALPPSEPFYRVQQYYASLDINEARAYWQDYLLQCVPTILPGREPEESQNIEAVARHEFSCKLQELHNSAAKLQISVQCFFQAALFHLVSGLTDNEDNIIAVVTSGRTVPIDGIENTFGPCMRALPMRVNLSQSRYISDLLRNTHQLNRRLVEYAAVSVQDIKRFCGVDPGISLSDVLFIWQESSESRKNHHNSFRIVDSSNNVESKIVIEIEPHDERITSRAIAREWTLSITLAEIFSQLDEVVSLMVANPNADLSLLPVLFDGKSIEHDLPPTSKLSVQQIIEDEDYWTPKEILVRKLISDITETPERTIKKHVSIFRFGVDSISAIHLARRLREDGFGSASVSMVLKYSTISSLAQALNNQIDEQNDGLSEPVTLLSDQQLDDIKSSLLEEGLQLESILPCTPLQVTMLSSSNADEKGTYCNVMVFKVLSDPFTLLRSVDTVIQRHKIFRTVFIQTENSHFPFVQGLLKQHQNLWESKPEQCEEVKLDEISLTVRASRCISQLQEQMRPLISLRSFQHKKTHYLEFICHHAVYDASAIQVLIQEVESQYRNEKLERPVSSESFLQLIQSTQTDDAEKFWLRSLKNFRPILLRYPPRPQSGFFNSALSISLRYLEAASRDLSVTLANILQAALAKVLSRLFDCKDVCFGNVINGRTHSIDSLERLVFPTFNTVPLRTNFSKLPDNRSLLTYLRDFTTTSDQFNLFPLRRIQQRLDASGNGLFSALLLVQQGLYQLDRDIWELITDLGNINVR